MFNLSRRTLSEIEIRVLDKGLGFVPTPSRINEAPLRQDFNEFPRKMRCKWHFRDEVTDDFSETPYFRKKSDWKPPKGYLCLELFLSKVEEELFTLLPGKPFGYNLDKEEWMAMKDLAEDKSIIIKSADKGFCVVIWDREDYLAEAEKQLGDEHTYRKVENFSEKDLRKLVEKSNSFFQKLLRKKLITQEEFKYFSYELKNNTYLGKMYLLPKIHKRLEKVPRPSVRIRPTILMAEIY